MRLAYSAELRDDLSSSVLKALESKGIINVSVLAEAIRVRHLVENIALEDVELMVLETAKMFGAAMEFDNCLLVQPTEQTLN